MKLVVETWRFILGKFWVFLVLRMGDLKEEDSEELELVEKLLLPASNLSKLLSFGDLSSMRSLYFSMFAGINVSFILCNIREGRLRILGWVCG